MSNALKLSTSRKVAPLAHPIKGAKVKNCFALPAGRNFSCRGATDQCDPATGGYCYAGRDERRFPSVRALVEHNYNLLRDASVDEMVALLDAAVCDFDKVVTRRGLVKAFRIHEDGDFFSVDYARAWAIVIRRHPDIQFWAYTRSYTRKVNVVPVLAGIPNLALYVSVDSDNRALAATRVKGWQSKGVLPALVSDPADVQEVSVSLTGRRSPVCPEIAGKIPLVNSEGVGACIMCGMCPTGRQPVVFPLHK